MFSFIIFLEPTIFVINKVRVIIPKIALILAALFAVLLPYDARYSTVIIFPLILTAVLLISKNRLRLIPTEVWIFQFVFILSILGYLYSTDTWRAGYLIERQLAILLFPIILPLTININRKNIEFILSSFTASCLVATLYLLYTCFFFLYTNHQPLSFLKNKQFYNHSFSHPLNIHAGYLSLYLSLSIFFLLDKLNAKKLLRTFCYSLVILTLYTGLFFLASRNTIIATIVVSLFIFPFFKVKNKIWAFVFPFLAICIFLWIGNQSNYINTRFSKELIGDIKIEQQYSVENPEPRIQRWQCAWELIKQRPFWGYGTGDEINLMKGQYLKRRMMISYSEEFNTHNQYLAILLKNGMIGLLLFLLMMIYFFRLAIRSKDFIYFSFLILFFLGLITENMLDTNKGIFFFAFFNTLFGYQILMARKE